MDHDKKWTMFTDYYEGMRESGLGSMTIMKDWMDHDRLPNFFVFSRRTII